MNPAAAMFSDPNAMMEMMKKNLSMIVPQVGRVYRVDFSHWGLRWDEAKCLTLGFEGDVIYWGMR